jgi:hypothetical protein
MESTLRDVEAKRQNLSSRQAVENLQGELQSQVISDRKISS